MPTVLSKEQREIVNCLIAGKCCISDSVPGAGKTTTGIEIARELPMKLILCLTFSSSLKAEGQHKVTRLPNIDVESYNSWILKFYGKGGVSKEEVFEVLRDNEKLRRRAKKYDIIILDETQDMNILYYQMVLKFVKDSNIDPIYLVIGDKYQGVFEFLGADRRYLTLAERLFKGSFERHYLTHSFRLTDTMSRFINEAVLGESRIITNKPTREKVSYLVADPFNYITHERIFSRIEKRLNQGARVDDFFILFAGMKPGTPAPKLDRYLKGKGLNIAFFDSDTDNVGEEEMRNKIVMTTFHKSKGRERKYVFVFNVDTSYFKYYKKGENPNVCPPELYVAMTRATEKLWIIQGISHKESFRQCPFFKLSLEELHKSSYCKLKKSPNINNKDFIQKYSRMDGPIPALSKHEFSVSDIIKYIPDKCEEELYPLLNPLFQEIYGPDGHQADIPQTILSAYDTSESISDLVGTAIPSYIGHKRGIRGDIHRMLDASAHHRYSAYIRKIHNPPNHIEDHLLFSNIQKSVHKGTESNLRQINNYDEIVSHENVECCELNSHRITLTNDSNFEEPLSHLYRHREYGHIRLTGLVDSLSRRRLYEFKCVSHLKFEHKLQLAVYAWILHKEDPQRTMEYYLFNFFTGELLQMRYDESVLQEIMEYLFLSKYQEDALLEDNEFLRKCDTINEAHEHTKEYSKEDADNSRCEYWLFSSDEED